MIVLKNITDRSEQLVAQLLSIWENSVRATHHFLSEQEILDIKVYVPEALKNVPVLVVAYEENTPVAFMGISHTRLEMLFVDEIKRGHGIGKQLLTEGIERYGVMDLAVNEQNPSAKAFYEKMGFVVKSRSPLDEQGNPYPIL